MGSNINIKVVMAFVAIYLIWGSTYLGIRFAIDTIPPFLMAGVRFLIAGSLLYGWLRLRGTATPAPRFWIPTGIIGILMLAGGNGMVTWAEQWIPSALAALLVASVTIWIVLLEWLYFGVRPTVKIMIGLLFGLAGVTLLIGPTNITNGDGNHLAGTLAVVAATFFWASGAVYTKRVKMPDSLPMATAMEMLAGGGFMVLLGLLLGEGSGINLEAVTLQSVLALGYLILFGSLIAFSAFVYLLRTTSPARVGTYAYVNPVMAVLLGWSLGGETITMQMLLGALITIGSVALITTQRQQPAPEPEEEAVSATA